MGLQSLKRFTEHDDAGRPLAQAEEDHLTDRKHQDKPRKQQAPDTLSVGGFFSSRVEGPGERLADYCYQLGDVLAGQLRALLIQVTGRRARLLGLEQGRHVLLALGHDERATTGEPAAGDELVFAFLG